MKKKVKQYGQQIEVGTQDRRHVLKDFSRMLDNEVCWKIGIRSAILANTCKNCSQSACFKKLCDKIEMK